MGVSKEHDIFKMAFPLSPKWAIMPSSETKWMHGDQSALSCLVGMSEAHQASLGSLLWMAHGECVACGEAAFLWHLLLIKSWWAKVWTYVIHGSWATCFMPVEAVHHTRKGIDRKHLIFLFFEDEISITQRLFSLMSSWITTGTILLEVSFFPPWWAIISHEK